MNASAHNNPHGRAVTVRSAGAVVAHLKTGRRRRVRAADRRAAVALIRAAADAIDYTGGSYR